MFLKVKMECNFSHKAQSGMNWQVPAHFSSAEIWPLGTRCATRPIWTSHRPVWYSLFLLLLLLPEALQQDALVGGIKHSRLLQVLFSNITEELQIIPAVV